MDDLEIIDVSDIDDVDVLSNENEYNIVEDIFVDDEVYVSDTISEDLPDLIEAGQFYIYLPIASVFNKGIAKFNSNHFTVIDGLVYAKLTPKAISDELGNNIINTYQRKDNMIEQWISEIREGTYPSAKLVKDSLDNIIYNKGKGVFVFTTQEDFFNWIDGNLETDINGKTINDLVVGDDIFMLDGSINYWCKKLSDPLTINDFMSYAKSIWGSITGDIQEQADLIELLNNIENEIPKTGQDIVLADDNKGTITDAIINTNVRIDNIVEKIPNQASKNNQLADKDFVNSSIETATATFRGTYKDLSILKNVIADKNDYAFYDHIDDLGNRVFDRYKHNGIDWLYEYSLNNSSFTDAQWKAINSGATVELINKILANEEHIEDLQGYVSQNTQKLARALLIPTSAPSKVKVVGVDETNSQVLIDADELGGGTKIIWEVWE